MLTPWHDPVPLKRSWCLWEMHCALQAKRKVRLSIALPPDQWDTFLADVTKSVDAISDALARIDAAKSEARDKSDENAIHTAVRGGIGFDLLNMEIKNHLHSWYQNTAQALAEEAALKEDGGSDALFALAVLCRRRGDDDTALRLFEQCLELRCVQYGEEHEFTAAVYSQMGSTLHLMHEYDKALEMREKALQIYLATLGEQHPETAATYDSLGSTYYSKGKFDKALQMHEKALQIQLATLGEQHPSTATTYSNMGIVYNSKGEHDKVMQMHEKALQIKLATLGEKHPSTAWTYNFIGHAYSRMGEHGKALQMHEKVLPIRQATLGQLHPSTLATYTNIGNAYEGKGEYDKAVQMHEKVYHVTLAMLGLQYPLTVEARRLLNEAKARIAAARVKKPDSAAS